MKQLLKKYLQQIGYDIVRSSPGGFPPDMSRTEREIYTKVEPFTMTSVERVISLTQAAKYVVENHVEGDFVECGVWRGGSMMAVAHILMQLGDTTRKLYLYDTFAGMSPPTEQDKQYDGLPAKTLLNKAKINTGAWCYADKNDVRENLLSTGYPEKNILLIEGKVEETIPHVLPEKICLLRLDTDWYESTKHELIHLYPKLVRSGILIIDDYGHWQGARRATDEYFEQIISRPFLQRVDYTGRIAVKTE